MIDLIVTINLILTVLLAVGFLKLRRRLMGQEQELQEVQALLTDVVAPGVTEILSRLSNLPTDNPAIQDEIDGIKSVGQSMADQINAVLNPQPPEEPPTEP